MAAGRALCHPFTPVKSCLSSPLGAVTGANGRHGAQKEEEGCQLSLLNLCQHQTKEKMAQSVRRPETLGANEHEPQKGKARTSYFGNVKTRSGLSDAWITEILGWLLRFVHTTTRVFSLFH